MTSYPPTRVLRRGVILGGIVNAVMTAQNPNYASYFSWDERNYVLNGHDGRFGAVTFDGDSIVGAFFDVESEHSPFDSKGALRPDYDLGAFFQGMDRGHWEIAQNETLRFNQQLVDGRRMSVATAAFWNEGDQLTAARPWSEVLANGAQILEKELVENRNNALNAWRDAYDMSTIQFQLVRQLFDRRLAAPSGVMRMAPDEFELLNQCARGTDSLAVSQAVFEAAGILVPA